MPRAPSTTTACGHEVPAHGEVDPGQDQEHQAERDPDSPRAARRRRRRERLEARQDRLARPRALAPPPPGRAWMHTAVISGATTRKRDERGDDRLGRGWRGVEAARELLHSDAHHDQVRPAPPRRPRARGRCRRAAVDAEPSREQRAEMSRARASSSRVTPAGRAGAPPLPASSARAAARRAIALVDLVRRDARVGDAQRALAALEQEVRALDEQHAALAWRRSPGRATSVPSGRSTQRK